MATPAVLLVDDNEDILEFLTDELKEQYILFTATNAEDALVLLLREPIQLIVSDVMMPGMDGFELCRTIKTHIDYSHVPVILLTAKNTLQSKIEGLETGADAYIEKPFSPAHLQVQIANLLSNRNKIREYFANSPLVHIKSIAHSKGDEQFLETLYEAIIRDMDNTELDVDRLSRAMNMSRPTLYRKIKGISHLTPYELINITRLKKAAELLAQGQYKIFEIAAMTGFQSQNHFGKSFLKQFGMTPTDYTKQMKGKTEQ